MAVRTLPRQTTNFVFQYLDSIQSGGFTLPLLHARARAEALLQTCENDFAELKRWFGVNDGFGPENRITVRVQPDNLAHNNGYHPDGSMLITIDPLETLAAVARLGGGVPPVDQSVPTDGVRALFVAEAIEILMSYRNTKARTESWHLNYSDGEGLSRLAAAVLHPIGYYSPLLAAPFVNTWLTGTRGSWVATNDPTDVNSDSFGCAILFIYYLRDQLGFPITSIVQKAGATLEETYQALTGNTNGFKPFRDLLNKYLPFDPNNPNSRNNMKALPTDNPFPILERQERRVTLSFKEQDDPVGLPRLGGKAAGRGHVTVKPFFTCPAKSYGYAIYDRDRTLRCIASVSGFAQPKFTWTVNGLHANVGGSVIPTTTVLVDDPAHPDTPKSESKAVRIYWQAERDVSTFEGRAGELDLHNFGNSYDGHVQLRIVVEVSETFGTSDSVTQTGFTTLDTQEVVYDAAFYADRDACIAAFEKTIRRYVRVSQIPLVFTLPDPAPEIRIAARLLAEIMGELRAINRKNPQLGQALTRSVAVALRLPERMLSVAGEAGGPPASGRQTGARTARRRQRPSKGSQTAGEKASGRAGSKGSRRGAQER